MRAIALAAAVACVLVASGCGSSSARKSLPRVGRVAPDYVVGRTASSGRTRPRVIPLSRRTMRRLKRRLYNARFLSPTRLAIPGIAGSSNCPSVPIEEIVRSPHAIRLQMAVGSWHRTGTGLRVRAPHPPSLCLQDLVPTPVVLAIDPARIDVNRRLKVDVYYPKGVIRRYRRPVVFEVPPFATARIRNEVRVARSSNLRLFSIFPGMPGGRRCAILGGGPSRRRYSGICDTRVHARPTMEPSVRVTFTESWWPHCAPLVACSPRALRHHTWSVIEGETIVRPGSRLRVYATRSHGTTAPQNHK